MAIVNQALQRQTGFSYLPKAAGKLNVRPLSPRDGIQFIAMMNETYGRKKTLEYFYWQYVNAPEPSVLMGSFEGNKLIGAVGLKRRLLINGFSTCQIMDAIIAPAFRKRGHFGQLLAEALNLFLPKPDLYIALANTAGLEALEKIPGWRNVGGLRTFCLSAGELNFSTAPVKLSVTSEEERISFLKTSQYRDWRYGQNPIYTYFRVTANNGFTVVKVSTDRYTGTTYGDIVDLNMNSGATGKDLYNLMVLTCDDLKEQGAQDITTWAIEGTLMRDVVELLGFSETQHERYLCLHVINEDCKKLYQLSQWEIVEADAEIY